MEEIGDPQATIYGRFKGDIAFDSDQTNSNGNFVQWVSNEGGGDQMALTVRETRVGIDLTMGESITGKVEVDFFGGSATGTATVVDDTTGNPETGTAATTPPENKPTVLMRHVFAKMDLGNGMSLLAGQTSDIFSPIAPAILNYVAGWYCGNTGYRRPQLRFEYAVGETGILTQASVGRSVGGETSASADFQGRVGYTIKDDMEVTKLTVGASGLYGFSDDIVTRWFAPWDQLVRYWSVEQLYLDMYDRPELVHKGISRMVDAHLARLRQWEEQNLLSVGNGNHRVGSNGLGITNELPQADCDPSRVRPIDQWGTETGQIFSEVSPDMHGEFCLQYEMRWLERFGLNNYGCCEPLHNKMHILRKIPRLRKISISPKADKAKAAEQIGKDFVIALKPNPSVFAPERFSAEAARAALRRDLEPLRGLCVEIVMKDVTTIRNDPPRLHEWARIAAEVASEFAP